MRWRGRTGHCPQWSDSLGGAPDPVGGTAKLLSAPMSTSAAPRQRFLCSSQLPKQRVSLPKQKKCLLTEEPNLPDQEVRLLIQGVCLFQQEVYLLKQEDCLLLEKAHPLL